MKTALILAAQGADGGRALLQTLASAGMQAGTHAEVTVVLTGDAPESVSDAFPGVKVIRRSGSIVDAWRAGAEASDAERLSLLSEGDALFDAYSLWRLENELSAKPQAALAAGAVRCFDASGVEQTSVGAWALPQGTLARRDVLMAALARAGDVAALAAQLFAATEQSVEIADCVCECRLAEGWFDALCAAPRGLSGARAAEWAEKELAVLYLAYVRAGLKGPEAMQAARAECAAFFKAAWLPLESDMVPDALFASYGAAMDAAMRIDPDAAGGYEPYPMFADILRMECD